MNCQVDSGLESGIHSFNPVGSQEHHAIIVFQQAKKDYDVLDYSSQGKDMGRVAASTYWTQVHSSANLQHFAFEGIRLIHPKAALHSTLCNKRELDAADFRPW
jgi:DNA primase